MISALGTMDLTERVHHAELMDDPAADATEVQLALRHVEAVNRWLNGYGPTLAGIRRLLNGERRKFSLLDVGCGHGDTLVAIAHWARRHDLEAQLYGIELNADTAEQAAVACSAYPEIRIWQADLFDAEASRHYYDIVHAAMMLHHMPDDAMLVKALARMNELAMRGVLINDLHRHPLAYHGIRLLSRCFTRSRIFQHDAPLSVARSFRKAELLELAHAAGLCEVQVRWHWAFRWEMTATRTPVGVS